MRAVPTIANQSSILEIQKASRGIGVLIVFSKKRKKLRIR